MNKKFLKGINFILSAILVMLGFQSCDKVEEDLCEYGTPFANFVYQGKVTDSNGNPLEGSQVIVKPLQLSSSSILFDKNEMPWYNDTLKTDKDGIYKKEKRGDFPFHDYRIVVNDLSGKFENDSVQVKPVREEKGSGWYEGKFSISADFKLKEKKDNK